MTTYAIGDIHGCHATLERLLERIEFDPATDRLWLVGDLVNRGPKSLEVLRWARRHEHVITAVLGNHDLHLLARAAGIRPAKEKDTLDELLAARDRDELLDWLRRRPLAHLEHGWLLVHAGVHPAWNLDVTLEQARACEQRLRGQDWVELVRGMYESETLAWHEARDPLRRTQSALRVLSSIRTCDPAGRLNESYNGAPNETPHGWLPWFDVPGRRTDGVPTICGHWAAAGYFRKGSSVHLDSGCAWGNALTAFDIDKEKPMQVANADIPEKKNHADHKS